MLWPISITDVENGDLENIIFIKIHRKPTVANLRIYGCATSHKELGNL